MARTTTRFCSYISHIHLCLTSVYTFKTRAILYFMITSLKRFSCQRQLYLIKYFMLGKLLVVIRGGKPAGRLRGIFCARQRVLFPLATNVLHKIYVNLKYMYRLFLATGIYDCANTSINHGYQSGVIFNFYNTSRLPVGAIQKIIIQYYNAIRLISRACL